MRRNKHRDAFQRFHLAHPDVYQEMVRLARAVKARGYARYGSMAIWERLRWHFDIDRPEREGGGFKLNNNYRSHYADLIMAQEPDLAGFFLTRPGRPDSYYAPIRARRMELRRHIERPATQLTLAEMGQLPPQPPPSGRPPITRMLQRPEVSRSPLVLVQTQHPAGPVRPPLVLTRRPA